MLSPGLPDLRRRNEDGEYLWGGENLLSNQNVRQTNNTTTLDVVGW